METREETNKIILHCSATMPLPWVTPDVIRRWHKARGFDDIGYHYVIDSEGGLHIGRPLLAVGAHTYKQNHDSVGICIVGGVDENGKALFNFSELQLDTLFMLVDSLKGVFPEAKIFGHRDFTNKKECPVFSVKDMFRGMYE